MTERMEIPDPIPGVIARFGPEPDDAVAHEAWTERIEEASYSIARVFRSLRARCKCVELQGFRNAKPFDHHPECPSRQRETH